jgi:hypothetical protein
MDWHFRELAVGEKTRDPIQGEFFATQAIRNPADALVREGIQNSLDEALDHTVRVNILLGRDAHALPDDKAVKWFKGAWSHLHASGNGLREPPQHDEHCPFLVFEDFGTGGLQGDVNQAFDRPLTKNSFFYFFRAEGRSGKTDTAIGRWGVGKYVFPRSSRANLFFGLTIRADDSKRLLMGQTVLKSHKVGTNHYSPDGYGGERGRDGLILPLSDADTLDEFVTDFCLTRTTESGLSVVVPWLDPEFRLDHIKEAVVRGYFYPILTGALVVTVGTPEGNVEINAETLAQTALALKGDVAKDLPPLVELAEWAAFRPPQEIIKLNPCRPERPDWSDELIPSDKLELMRQKLASGEKLAVRASLTVREKGKDPCPTWFDFFLWQDGYEGGRPSFIREGVIISDMRPPRARGVRSLVVIEDAPIAGLLGDSENPAHTQWQRDSSNFKGKYIYGSAYIKFVTEIVASLVYALRAQEEQEDPTLLLDIFSLPGEEKEPQRRDQKKIVNHGKVEPPEPPDIEPRKKRFRIQKIKGGFAVIKGDASTTPPAELDIRMAYDVRRGNPLKKYHPADFRVEQRPIEFEPAPLGLSVISREANRIRIEITDPDFRLSVRGFDENRDLYVNVKMEERHDDSEV